MKGKIMDTFTSGIARNFSIALICAVLAACATTQRSSSGGEQAPAPIDDAGSTTPQTVKPDAQTKAPDVKAAPTPPAPAKPLPADEPAPRASATPPSESSAAAASAESEEMQLKRELAEQDAEINKIRSQRAEAAKIEQQAAQESQVSKGDGRVPVPEGTPVVTKPRGAAPSKREEDIAVFPEGSKGAQAAAAGRAAAGAELETENPAPPPGAMDRSVYFAYNEAAIPAKYDAVVLANAAYLKTNSGVKAEIQGNCDERGSREYNLALGTRRARAVKRALELAGTDASRIEVVSFGSEKPIATGKDEESYSKNRRVDIVY